MSPYLLEVGEGPGPGGGVKNDGPNPINPHAQDFAPKGPHNPDGLLGFWWEVCLAQAEEG